MNIFQKIRKARGGCIADTINIGVESVESAAKLFHLSDKVGIYKMIEKAEALELLKVVLHKDMAYGVKIMSSVKASNLAEELIGQFGEDAVYYSNGDYGKPRKNSNVGASWTPATEATFDTGVIVISNSAVSCVWFADED